MESGVGRVLESYPRRDGTGLSIGVVGLGVGTLAAYGAAGDHFSFYEVNPDVVSYAKGQGGYFSFLRDTKADYSVAIGDARVSLLKEIAKDTQKPFDILILDAFLGHAIPVHLLTVECFDLYLKRTRPEGVILVHIGNPHVDLEPQLSQIAAHFGLKSALFESRGDGRVTYDAVWVALTRDDALLTLPPIAPHHRVLERIEDRSVWTDGYSNLLEALR
jgi:hypothetical protein